MDSAQTRKRQQVDDLSPDHISLKKVRLSCPETSRTRHRKTSITEHSRDQIPSKTGRPGGGFLAISQNRKRRADDPLQDRTLAKKPRPSITIPNTSNFPPEFYDNLSRIWLTPRALQEHNRRNETLSPSEPRIEPAVSRGAKLAALEKFGISKLALFAIAGGPDLSDLKGCPKPTSVANAMTSSSKESSSSQRTRSTRPTTVSTKRSSAYDANFRQHCINNSIYPPFYRFPDGRRAPKPANLDEIRQALKVPRASLSPTVASEEAFEDFQYKNTTMSEGTVMRTIIPFIAGDADIPNEGQRPFTNLASITDNATVNPNPDFFDGAHPEALDPKVREALGGIIIPTKKAGTPVAPNLFLEAKSSGGTAFVAENQIILDGAHGAIMMHTLQNYLLDEPVYDGNAYAFTAISIAGSLTLYCHHVTAPAEPGLRLNIHTTQVHSHALTGAHGVWLGGIGSFRNLRKLAKRYRDELIDIANSRARQRSIPATLMEPLDLVTTVEEHPDDCSSPLDFYDCQMFAEPRDDEKATQDTEELNIGLAIFDPACSQDDTDDVEVATDFTTSFASSLTSSCTEDRPHSRPRPNLPRTPPSPSSPRRPKKREQAKRI